MAGAVPGFWYNGQVGTMPREDDTMQLHRWHSYSLRLLLYAACVATALTLAGCRGTVDGVGAATPTPDSIGSSTPDTALATTTPAFPGRQLIIWLTDDLNTTPDTAAGESFAQAIRQFELSHPNVDIQWQIKPATGQNSLAGFLGSAQQVAPSIVPDLVLLDSRALWQLSDLGLISPLDDGLLARIGDFYPFALDAVLYNGVELGVPYIADVQHLAYAADKVTQPPATWQQLSEQQVSYLFPVAGQDGIDAVLLQYVGAGGELLASGQSSDPKPLQSLFSFLEQARSQEIIPTTIQDQASLEQVWAAFTAGETVAANVAASKFRREKESNRLLGYGQTPIQNDLSAAVARTWALAVTAVDPEQRSLALEFIDHLLSPDLHGNWSQAADRLPTRRPAWEKWSNRGDYHAFLGRLLEVAVTPPAGAPFADFARRLRDAQLAVLRGETTAEQAVLFMGAAP